MMPNWKTLHKDFRLSGFSYSKEELKALANSFIKEGREYEKAIGNFLHDWVDENESIKVKTSGSTGKPKEISLKKSQMANSALATGAYFDLKSSQTALLCLSADYIAGKMMLVRAMVLGLELDFVEPTSNPLVDNLKNYDFCAMVPLQLENSIDRLKNIKKLIVGGASVSNTLKSKLQRTSCQVFETYGMTETITHVAAKDIGLSIVDAQTNFSFKALPNLEFSKDERDCLVINAPKVSDEKIITNDVVNLISKTEFKWLGRYDNVINSGGVKLFPEQIEAKLDSLISNRFFVAGLSDDKLGQKLVLIIEGQVDTDLLSQKLYTLSFLDKYEIPKSIFTLPEFLETKTGKIQRQENINLILS